MTQTFARAALALATLALAGCTAAGGPASEPSSLSTSGRAPAYLALGDSIPFGYDPLESPAPTPNKYLGYPKLVAGALDLPQINAACPGETSASVFDATAVDNGCDAFRAREDLHVDYSGEQLDVALGYLGDHDRVQLVTVQLGANDLLMLLARCGGDLGCALQGLPPVLQAVAQNLAVVLGSLRAAGYDGPIILPGYYSTDYGDAASTGAIAALDQVIALVGAAYGAELADVFGAFQLASAGFDGDPCAAGLLIRLPDGRCDKHPSRAGAQLIADAVVATYSP